MKTGVSDIELMLFVADKLTWNTQNSKPILPYFLPSLVLSFVFKYSGLS